MTPKKEQTQPDAIRAVLEDLGLDPHAKAIEWSYNADDAAEVVVAHSGDRTFVAPEVCSLDVGVPGRWSMHAEVMIVGGRPRFREIDVVFHEALAPLDVQRLPWAKIAEGVVAGNAAETSGGQRRRASSQTIRDTRARAKRRAGTDEPQEPRERTAVDEDKLAEVVRLRREAMDRGVRWDEYAADRMGYSKTYCRKLYGRARKEGMD